MGVRRSFQADVFIRIYHSMHRVSGETRNSTEQKPESYSNTFSPF